MPTTADRVAAFRALHVSGQPFVIANAWDAGSARILEGVGFAALATTSSGFALTLGRRDYRVGRAEAIEHCRLVSDAVDVPVSADLENGFGPTVEDAAKTIELALETRLAGGSIEDSSGSADQPILDRGLAEERVTAAVEAAAKAPAGFVLTARAEGLLWGASDLDEVISRLQAFGEAGADVLFAPGLPDLDAVRAVCSSVDRPVNVLALGELASRSIEELAEAGAARISVGGALAFSAYASLVQTAECILRDGAFSGLGERLPEIKRLRGWLD